MRVLVFGLAFALCVAAFYDARALNSGFVLPRQGLMSVPASELVFYAWYALYGSLATAFLALLLAELGVSTRALRVVDWAVARAARWVCGLACLGLALSLAFRHFVLLGQRVTDDEDTYLFIARTLLTARLTNPLPEDAEFFANQFIVMNEQGWHGKYPIGHPLVLALGEAFGGVELVVPVIGALCVVLTYQVGRRLFDPRVALLGTALIIVSPHFVWTCATMLSQPTACALMLLGMLALLRLSAGGALRWSAVAGAAIGFGVLVRPLPGVLFALVALTFCVVDARRQGASLGSIGKQLAVLAGAALPFLVTALAVNYVQSGSPFRTGYHDVHKTVPLLPNAQGEISNSVGGALIRENFWLLGWTFSLLLVPFCRPKRAALLFWGMLGAELAYRVIAPKTVVAVTGPTYLTESVPLLLLAVADAAGRLGRCFATSRVRPADVALAASITGVCMFMPLQVAALRSGSQARLSVYDQLRASGADQALVFASALATGGPARTWAYYPDNPSPWLNDRLLFVRVPVQGDARARMLEFWRRRFPERRAFVFHVDLEGGAKLTELRSTR